MKYFIILLSIFLFSGCLYFNDRGVSAHLYDNCHSYYDGDGNFIEKCDENIIDYDEAKEGIVAIKDEIAEDLRQTTTGINIQDLSLQEQNELMKEKAEIIKSPCK